MVSRQLSVFDNNMEIMAKQGTPSKVEMSDDELLAIFGGLVDEDDWSFGTTRHDDKINRGRECTIFDIFASPFFCCY